MAKKHAAAAVDIRHYDVVLAPHITEKSTMLSEQNAVVFKVASRRLQARDQGRGRGAVRRQGDRRQHDRHQGQDQALEGQALQALGRQEGDRHPGRRPVDRHYGGGLRRNGTQAI